MSVLNVREWICREHEIDPKDARLVDIGDNHFYRFTEWSPNRELNPQHAHLPDVNPCGAIVYHLHRVTGSLCISSIMFDIPAIREAWNGNGSFWTVDSLEPLTVSPSLLCRECGDHGFIRGGRWVVA
jgi:hypothetical protein